MLPVIFINRHSIESFDQVSFTSDLRLLGILLDRFARYLQPSLSVRGDFVPLRIYKNIIILIL